jgi:hypothetical protein
VLEAINTLSRFRGFHGIVAGISFFFSIWLLAWIMVERPKGKTLLKGLITNHSFNFEPPEEKGAFEKLLSNYFDIAKVVLGFASGSIVLLVGSAAFRSGGRLSEAFASPLFLLALCIFYGVLFMVLTMLDYEAYRHKTKRYTRLKYSRNQAFGFACLLCFCVGYMWLIVIVTEQP